MKETRTPRLMIAAPKSGGGKTTIVCALLRALQKMGLTAAAFKSGPDYIDPLFHSRVLQTASHTLDLFLFGRGGQGAATARYLLASGSDGADIAVLEGAMGYYDGVGTTSEASAYDLAKVTNTPVVLVVDGSGAGLSLAAQIKGTAAFRRDSRIAGFIVNHVKPGVYAYFKDAWEKETGLTAFGCFPDMAGCAFASRHLGLVTAGEIEDFRSKIDALAEQAMQSVDMDALVSLARSVQPLPYEVPVLEPAGPARIAVARDEAFCFYYEDSLTLLKQLGAELVYFSPLHDERLPDCEGVYLGGGYPELYAEALAANAAMKGSLKRALSDGMPCVAECGGFMYLLEEFSAGEQSVSWCGVLPGSSKMTDHLTRFGYVTLTAEEDTMLCRRGDTICAHEFHYSDSTDNGAAFTARKASGRRSWPCGRSEGRIVAAYPHIHFWSNPDWARRFVAACRTYREERHHED